MAAGSLRTNTKRAEEAAAVRRPRSPTRRRGRSRGPSLLRRPLYRFRRGHGDPFPGRRKAVSRSVFQLAWPAIAENALQTMLGIVDTAVVARLGMAALSGVGVSQQLIWVLTTALVAVSMGTTVVIAHFHGRAALKQASAVLKQSLMLATVFGIWYSRLWRSSRCHAHGAGPGPQAAHDGAVTCRSRSQRLSSSCSCSWRGPRCAGRATPRADAGDGVHQRHQRGAGRGAGLRRR